MIGSFPCKAGQTRGVGGVTSDLFSRGMGVTTVLVISLASAARPRPLTPDPDHAAFRQNAMMRNGQRLIY